MRTQARQRHRNLVGSGHHATVTRTAATRQQRRPTRARRLLLLLLLCLLLISGCLLAHGRQCVLCGLMSLERLILHTIGGGQVGRVAIGGQLRGSFYGSYTVGYRGSRLDVR